MPQAGRGYFASRYWHTFYWLPTYWAGPRRLPPFIGRLRHAVWRRTMP